MAGAGAEAGGGAAARTGGDAGTDAELRTHGYPNLGFANPLLYKIARSRLRRLVFRDVRAGSYGESVGCVLKPLTVR